MDYISESYYKNLYYEILNELDGGNEFLRELLEGCVFNNINKINEDTPLKEKLLAYKIDLKEFMEGFQWPYTRRKNKEEEESGFLRTLVGKESSERIRKITKQVLDMLDDFNKLKSRISEEIKKRKREGIIIGATLLSAIIIKKAYDIYQKHLYGSCVKLSGKERILCEMKMLEGYRDMLIKQMENCNITSHPVRCQRNLKKAIDKIDEKLIKFAEALA